MGLSDAIRKFDLYSKHIPLFFNGKRSYKTTFGGILVILSGIVGIMFFIFFGWDMFLRRNPKILTVIEELKKVDLFQIEKGNMLIAVRVENEFTETISGEGIFDIKFQKVDFTNNLGDESGWNGNITNLNTIKCNSSHLRTSDLLNSLSIREAFCPDLTSTHLGGVWSSDRTSHFRITVLLCSNKTKGNEGKCKSSEEISKIINSVWINYYVTDFIINTDNYKVPGTEKINYGYYSLSDSAMKMMDLYMNRVKVLTDTGFIMSDKSLKEFLVVDSMKSDVSIGRYFSQDFQTDAVFYLNLYQNNKVVTFEREYLKIQQVLANVGGILKVLVIICQFLNSLISTDDYLFTLMNNFFFNFEKENNKKNDPNTNKVEIRNVIKVRQTKSIVQSSISEMPNFQKFQDIVREKRREPFKFNICTIFKLLLGIKCFKSNKFIRWEKELNLYKNYLKQTLEIKNIISMHYQISILKFLFLDEDQLKALKFITTNNNKIQENLNSEFRESEKDLQEVFESLMSSGGEVNSKILELIQNKEN